MPFVRLLAMSLLLLCSLVAAAAADRQTAFIDDRLGGCTYTLSPNSANVFSSGGTVSFTVSTQAGCAWTATSSVAWVQVTSGTGTGTGSVSLTVAANIFTSPPRTANVSVGGQTFAVSQAGSCQWVLGSEPLNISQRPGRYTISVGTRYYCDFRPFLSTNEFWITNLVADVPNQTLTFDVGENFGPVRTGSLIIGAAIRGVVQASWTATETPFDFDGDSRTDLSIFRPGAGEWWYYRSSDQGNRAFQFGTAEDTLVPADYTGDAKADFAFYRNGVWYVLRSEDFSFYSFPLGISTDVPAPADFDGDNKIDPTVYRPSTGEWFIQRSTGGVLISTFGVSSDRPVPADYDGDGKADLAVFRPFGTSGNAEWWYQRSLDGNDRAFAFGEASDNAVPGDYTGDRKADFAVYRPSTGTWYILRSSDFSFYSFPFGVSTDTPAPGDYDGDGRFDAAVFRDSNATWYVQRSTSGMLAQRFGVSSDIPVPSSAVR